MPVKPLRRIGAPVNDSLHDRLAAYVLNVTYWRSGSDVTEREHPDLIVERDGNILAVDDGRQNLIYGFENPRAFVEHFPDMFEELLPRMREQVPSAHVRFRLTYSPARPVVEPVLRRLAFTPERDWLGFTLDRATKLPPATVPGTKFRAGTLADVNDIVRIDDEAFPDSPIALDEMRRRFSDDRYEFILATTGKDVAGFVLIERPEEGTGWISILAVADAHRGRGIGRALTVRGAKRLFTLGAHEAGLSTDSDNANAIRLYVGLGFRQDRAGRDYRRPVSDEAVEQLRREKQGTFIKFGGWR
jgi:ribosomal-protein-alanine N-acetyltransferase